MSKISPTLYVSVLGISFSLFIGCSTVNHSLKFNEGYLPPATYRVEVSTVTNVTGQQFEQDVTRLLTNALRDAFYASQLSWDGSSQAYWLVNSKIQAYDPGNAFKRWLWPG